MRHHRKAVTQFDLQEAVDTILAGAQKKNKILNDKEKCIVAYHEVGHALVAALQTHSAPVQKITIVPRTSGALGFTMQVDEGDPGRDPEQDRHLYRRPCRRGTDLPLGDHRCFQRY